MKVGLFIDTQFPEGDNVAARVPELVEQVRTARAGGFASLLFPHHYLTDPLQMLQIGPLMACLPPEAKGMKIGGNILLFAAAQPRPCRRGSRDIGRHQRWQFHSRGRSWLPRGRV